MTRVISGFVMTVAAIALTLYLPPIGFFVVIALAVGVGADEWYRLLEKGGHPALTRLGVVGAIGLSISLYSGDPATIAAYVAVFMVAAFGAPLLTGKEQIYETGVNTAIGALYVGATLTCVALLRNVADGERIVLLVLACNAFGDIFAYYTGRAIGKTPLAPAISPKKTMEGFVGGVLGAIASSIIIVHFAIGSLTIIDGLAIGVIAAIFGPMGDLVESALKRSVDAKDSGTLIPGHGGLLDRADSLMFTAPLVYAYLLSQVAGAGS